MAPRKPEAKETKMSNATQVKFVVGESYATQSICDSDCTFSMVIVSRTEKTATVSQYNEKPRRYKIHESWDGTQEVIRLGSYSMAGSWGAKDTVSKESEAPVAVQELAEDELPVNCVPFRRKAT